MKIFAVLPLVGLLLFAAAPARALDAGAAEEYRNGINAHPAECARLRRQINHFGMMYQRAALMENELWASRMGGQILMLQEMQKQRCPGDVPVDEVSEALKQLFLIGAKAAITYFTFGAGGFGF